MKTIMASTRLPKEIFERIETFAESKKVTLSSVLSTLICDHFKTSISPEDLETFTRVSKALAMMSYKKEADDVYFKEIGKELVDNLMKNPDGTFKRTQKGMYYFHDTEKLGDLITEYLEAKAEG